MGSVWFKWQNPQDQLLILQTRYDRVFKTAGWWNEDEETKCILGDRDEKTGGTLLGCSKKGRVAFLVDVTSFTNAGAELLTVKFLKGKMTPKEFAREIAEDKNLSLGLTFYLVVADIHSKSMVYISKNSPNKEIDEINYDVGPGFYSITSAGINNLTSPENKRLEDEFSEILSECENRELPMKVFVDKLVSDDTSHDKGQDGYYNGITMLVVKPTGKANLYERYLENHKFSFDIEKLE
ncbi:unnamed protein product [Arabis nemorensis]|uniref:Uncharacterized protein n=1 Tax=Arabis nemorensis TaxID=586526 RepID=A0A565ARC3_9BRAS|nr:unnamed protein product [Arabis nemorensis]